MAVKDYNVDPDLNTTIEGINIAEGCPPSGINNAIRQLMADVKENSTDLEGQIEDVETGASQQVSALDTTLRALIAAEVAKKLNISGGTMTGALQVSKIYADSTVMDISVGDTWNTGPSLSLYGMDYSQIPGAFILRSGENAYELIGKADGALTWDKKLVLTSGDSAEIAGYAFPSGNYTVLTPNANGATYTAPDNGFFSLTGVTNDVNGRIELFNNTSRIRVRPVVSVSGMNIGAYVPAMKGDSVYVGYAGLGELVLRFVYAKGS